MGVTETKWAIEEQADLIATLEEKAGITGAVREARETGSPDKLRDAYYSVTDSELRNQLIATTGKLDQLYLQQCEQEESSASAAVTRAIEKTKKHPWHLSIAASLGAVVIGNWILGLFGAIAGALIGYYLGEYAIALVKQDDIKAVEHAKLLLVAAQKQNAESRVDPYLFSESEQQGNAREH